MTRGKKLRDRALSVTKSEAEEQEQIRLVESPEPELEPRMMGAYLDEGSDHFYNTKSSNTCAGDKQQRIIIERPVLTQLELNPKYSYNNEASQNRSWVRWYKKIKCKPKDTLMSVFPILTWLPNYEWRSISFDLVAGFVVAVLNIPQGMAYAMLGSLPAIVGIYMAFFPVIIYAILGTSRHVSMGTFAVICLMSGKAALDYQNSHGTTTQPDYTILQITTAITFAVGIWQALMGICRLGALSLLLNAELVSGFTTGAAVHVLTSQVKNLLGLSLPRRNGIFKLIYIYIDVGKNIEHSNVAAVIISIITIAVLVLYNELLKPIWSRKIPFPLPIELIAIVIGTLVSKYWNLNDQYDVTVVGHIPTGLPTPELPNFKIVTEVIFPDSLIIAVVAYAISVSMAKIFAAKHNYVVRPNQELLAQGGSNFVGSFFSCGPISASLSRSLIQEQVGGRTQLASLVSCFILVFVLLWIGPFFETLPNCVLSSIIAVALKGMFLQVADVKSAWRVSKLNTFIWMITFLSTVLLDIEYGLGVGVVISIITLMWRSNRANFSVLGAYGDTELYADISSNPQMKELPCMKIVKYVGTLNFATAENFCAEILKLVPLEPAKGKRKLSKLKPTITTISREKIAEESISDGDVNIPVDDRIQWLVLDMSGVSSLDPEAARAIKALLKKYEDAMITFLITGCTDPVIEIMKENDVLSQVGSRHVFPTVHDAVIYSEVRRLALQDSRTQYDLYNSAINHSGTDTDEEIGYQELESSIRRHGDNNGSSSTSSQP